MKYFAGVLYIIYLSLISCEKNHSTIIQDTDNIILNGIRWQGDDEIANYMAAIGLNRYLTFENNHAFIMSEAAVNKDSTLFASHVILALLAKGERKSYHKMKAKKFVDNENKTSKLFVKLLDFNQFNDSTFVERRNIWAEMHQLSNSPFIHYMYIRLMDGDNRTKIEELDKLIAFSEANKFNSAAAAAYNYKGYLHKYEGDQHQATLAIDRAIALHPNGYNPIDSRAEFHLYARDTTQAISSYNKVLEKFPYAHQALDKLKKLGE